MIYRYYKRATTEQALKTVRRLVERGRLRPADIVSFRGTYSVQRCYRLTIRTRHEQFKFTGFSWFYYGSGPLALQLISRWLLLPEAWRSRFTDIQYQGDTYQPNSFFIPANQEDVT
ncbi:hypothetical protein UY416_24375 [Paenibacillus polymyxa]|uniref:hypothetical protein n=1 Tax=Paenibacillus polymyxa TaxID=1406 RepID=UPI002AB4C90F|nr:hypothetical protein [Paenibacillus polymyxa]MDY8049433.1 hypothetical protein [Paenibacillus polymyxa]